MRTFLVSIVVWAAFCGATLAQTIQTKPDGGRLLGYAGAESPGQWVVFAAGFLEVKPEVISGGAAILFQGPAGEYAIIYFGPESAEPIVTKVVLGGGVPPIPPIPPDPDPPDPPLPPGGPWQIVLFYDGGQLDNYPPSQRNLLTSLALRKQLQQDGHDLLEILESAAVNNGTVVSKLEPWIKSVKGKPFPRVALAPVAGGTIQDFPLPADETAFLALLKATPAKAVKR